MKIERGMSAYVSGGGSGIGRGISLALAARGVNVGVVDIRESDAAETARQITSAGGKAIPLPVDVSDASSVEAAADHIEGTFGPVSIVCNNAGVAMHGVPLHEIEMSDWDWAIGVNVYVIHTVARDVPLGQIFRGCIPFVLGILAFVAIMAAYPEVVLFLVN